MTDARVSQAIVDGRQSEPVDSSTIAKGLLQIARGSTLEAFYWLLAFQGRFLIPWPCIKEAAFHFSLHIFTSTATTTTTAATTNTTTSTAATTSSSQPWENQQEELAGRP